METKTARQSLDFSPLPMPFSSSSSVTNTAEGKDTNKTAISSQSIPGASQEKKPGDGISTSEKPTVNIDGTCSQGLAAPTSSTATVDKSGICSSVKYYLPSDNQISRLQLFSLFTH